MALYDLPEKSVYTEIDASEIDVNNEISRWKNCIIMNTNHLETNVVPKEAAFSMLRHSIQNLEYLLSLPH